MQAKRQEVRAEPEHAEVINWTEPERDENGQIYCPGAKCGQKLKNLHSYQRHLSRIHAQRNLFSERAKVGLLCCTVHSTNFLDHNIYTVLYTYTISLKGRPSVSET